MTAENKSRLRFACALLTGLAATANANVADVKIVSSVGMRAVLTDLTPQFERTTGHKLIITFGSAAPLERQIDAGADFDVALLTPPMLADLAKSGKVVAASVVNVAKTGMGLAASQEAAEMDIGSAQRLKQVLLGAKSIAYSREGQSGIAAAQVIDKLGITEQLKPRIVLETRPGGSVTAVVEGRAQLGFGLLSEIVPEPRVKLVGPLPAELQTYIVFAAGISSKSMDAVAARAFVDFLRGSQVRTTLSAKGMEPM